MLHLPLAEGLSAQERKHCEAIALTFEGACGQRIATLLLRADIVVKHTTTSLKSYIALLHTLPHEQQAVALSVFCECAYSVSSQDLDVFAQPTPPGVRPATSRAVFNKVWGGHMPAVWAKYLAHHLVAEGALDAVTRVAAVQGTAPDVAAEAALEFLGWVVEAMYPTDPNAASPACPALEAAVNAAPMLDPWLHALEKARQPSEWLFQMTDAASRLCNNPNLVLTRHPAKLVNSALTGAWTICHAGGSTEQAPDKCTMYATS